MVTSACVRPSGRVMIAMRLTLPRWSGGEQAVRPAHRRDQVRGPLDGVPGGFGVVAAPGRGGPPERSVGELLDGPSGLLLEPVVVPALRTMAVLADIGIELRKQSM
jgi:hypothetical protein